MLKFKWVERNQTDEETQKKQNLFLEYDGRIMDGLPNVRQDIQ